ncbi:MAG: monovalent cation/H+ antiporter complex subunit F [Yoonia sp.]|jgi:multicomponent Na+:H+ antiporter subunit F|uniref:monovalent cation/H+ antiporter complex subunit F n=1 Tax=Yoonia sp. TaxID=2212373 RepID=UPI00273EF393|nr:monovalent cation/H+ antiporter complex subunit F [Yoonia sp.]MDP5084385.1 monovalent cation/H+ antiporter complex subunit F [Yoonia sp.]MDP5358602.1 monovalent cation/H+ antiporter complex subunit F [Paracoccaceae bacterium]MDP5362074.1 monovalent cation/H+ antiporter complex subunit F [Paracoccaceae bacterium]
MTSAEFLDLSIYASAVMVLLSLAIGFIRLARGPSLADRVVALDMMTVTLIAVCGLTAVATGVFALLDVALVLALVGFLATVALARFAERRDARAKEATDD